MSFGKKVIGKIIGDKKSKNDEAEDREELRQELLKGLKKLIEDNKKNVYPVADRPSKNKRYKR
jgi:hypothetical protein